MDETPLPTIDSRESFAQAVRWTLAQSMARPARRIVCVDADFADWPLDDPQLLQQLVDWFKRPRRSLVLVAASFDAMPRRHARFVAWRADWSHAVQAWSPAEGESVELPSAIVDDGGLALELIDTVHWRGHVSDDPRASQALRERVDAVLQRSVEAFPVNRLGLL